MDANRPMTLLMSPAVRDELSSVLQPYISQRYGRDPGPQENASSSVKNIIQMVQSTIIELNMKTISAVEILYNRQFLGSMFVQPPKIRSEEDEDMFLAKIAENMLSVLKSVVEALVGMGFTDMQAGHAAHHSLRCVLRETLRDGWGGPLLTSLHEVALEYLCLTIDENLLPEVYWYLLSFDAIVMLLSCRWWGRANLIVVRRWMCWLLQKQNRQALWIVCEEQRLLRILQPKENAKWKKMTWMKNWMTL